MDMTIANQGLNQQVMSLQRSIRSLEAHLRFLERQVQVKQRIEKRADSWWRGFWQSGRTSSGKVSSRGRIRPNRKKTLSCLPAHEPGYGI
jgi:hypothetical protein